MNNLVETAWDFVTKELSIGKEIASRWLTEIKRHYGEPQRHYHTLQHIEDMLALYEQYKDTVQRPCLVLLAIFFHDIIYDPTKPDNEEKSAELFDEFASEVKNLTTDHTKLVRKWILDTKDHHVIANSTEDVHLFMDIDMAILGTKDQVYDDYAEKIRSEYCHYKDEDFNKGRAKVLRGFRTLVYIQLQFSTRDLKRMHVKTLTERYIVWNLSYRKILDRTYSQRRTSSQGHLTFQFYFEFNPTVLL